MMGALCIAACAIVFVGYYLLHGRSGTVYVIIWTRPDGERVCGLMRYRTHADAEAQVARWRQVFRANRYLVEREP